MKHKNKLLTILAISVIALAIAGFIVADTQQDLQNELAQLEQELIDSGFGWLVNYKLECLNKLNSCLKNGNNI